MTKTAVITGAAGGIGCALVTRFQRAGYRVIGLDVDPQIEHSNCDVAIIADLAQLCQDSAYGIALISQLQAALGHDPLTVLINNAALQIVKPAIQLTPTDWHRTLDINLVAPFLLGQGLWDRLRQGKGSVINIASIHAALTKPEFVCYATSKAALVGLTRSLAVDWGPQVRVNAICPAAVATPMLLAGFADDSAALQQLGAMHPAGHIAPPEEVANAALYLADAGPFLTGTILNLDGGIGSRLHDPV